ncbi:hypothetical protein Tsubulata_050931, partial [Turnera subulata]
MLCNYMIFFLLFQVLLALNQNPAFGERMTEMIILLVIVAALLSSTNPLGFYTTPNSAIGSEKIELFHIGQIDHTINTSLHARLVRDKRRVDVLTHILTREQNMPLVSINVELGTILNTLEYIVRVGVGSPPVYQYMPIDTGIDLPWIQCQPCSTCYHQIDPIYNPKHSNTYRKIPCESTKCLLLGNQQICQEQQCRYKLGYGDRSSTKGVLGLETFVFGNAKISDMAFWCGHENKGKFINFAGLLGLGAGDLSFVGQLGGKAAGIFSFCLVDPGDATSGWMQIGGEAIPSGAAWVPMSYNPRTYPAYYYVGFSGISVGNKMVAIPNYVFQLNYNGQGGVNIDTGTVITKFPKVVYNAFRDAFVAQMNHFPRTHGVSPLDTCFNLSSSQQQLVPEVAFHFTGGVTLTLTMHNFLVQVEGSTIVCFAFEPAPSDFSILGNIVLQRIQITVDARSNRIGFGPNTCASKNAGWTHIRNESGSIIEKGISGEGFSDGNSVAEVSITAKFRDGATLYRWGVACND